MTKLKILALAFGLCATAIAQEQMADLTAETARVFSGNQGQTLTGRFASARGAAESFLRSQGRSAAAIASLVAKSETRAAASGLTHLRLEQAVGGRTVYGAYVKAAVNGNGELVHLIDSMVEVRGTAARSTVTADGAIAAAAAERFPGERFSFRLVSDVNGVARFSTGDRFFFQDPTATRIAIPLANGSLEDGWLVETWTGRDNQLWHTVVGNGGRILNEESRTANDSYRVFPEHPVINFGSGNIGTPETTIANPANATASPNGWISADGRTAGAQAQFRLSGNNSDAYLDRDANNTPDAAGAAIVSGDFIAAANLAADPTTAPNQQVAIQNLFYSVNLIHDKLYVHGFNEAAANFQENNFGKGGAGADSVLSEAQDGGGTNNANFSTPPDGSRPRMQMYLWTLTPVRRDGDVDSDIVFHEFGHGLTWRMIGSMSGCMSGAIGEGASDSVAVLMNADDVVGEYSFNNANGIRRFPYTNYPLKYDDLSGSSVHSNGELFAAIMWRAREKFLAAGKPLDSLWNHFVGGMNFIPAAPKYENMRDGIVQAAGGAVGGPTSEGCLIYKSFAEFNVGEGAKGRCFLNGLIWRVTPSATVPAGCQ
ncbi:MAG: M36 family metallopeptidase [Bryobacteraceae bacterium]